MIETVNFADAFARFHEHWSPRLVGAVNDTHIKLVKLQGEFVWHQHEIEDELFLVVQGQLTIRLRDHDLHLGAGEFVIIPHGIEHQPVADDEVQVLLIEPKSTVNTGSAGGRRTVVELERL